MVKRISSWSAAVILAAAALGPSKLIAHSSLAAGTPEVGCNVTHPNGVVVGQPWGRAADSFGNRFVSLPVPQEVVFRPAGPGFVTAPSVRTATNLFSR